MTLVDIRPGLNAYLLADAAVAAAVGTRIYPTKAPQGTTQPHIIYHFISGFGDRHMQGRSGLSRPRIQIDCWADTNAKATALALEVKERLEGAFGTWSWSGGSVVVQGCFFETERTDFDDATQLHLVSHDYLVWYEQG